MPIVKLRLTWLVASILYTLSPPAHLSPPVLNRALQMATTSTETSSVSQSPMQYEPQLFSKSYLNY